MPNTTPQTAPPGALDATPQPDFGILTNKTTFNQNQTMKNTTKTIVTATLQVIANTPQHEGTPSPAEVKEYLNIADGLCAGIPGLTGCDYEFKDLSQHKDGSYTCHVFTAHFMNRPDVVALGQDVSWTIVKFASYLYTPGQIIPSDTELKRMDFPEVSSESHSGLSLTA